MEKITWKHVVEIPRIGFGKWVFDKGLHGGHVEPGYYKGICQAIKYLQKGKPLTVKFYKKLHELACSHFDGNRARSGTQMTGCEAGHFRENHQRTGWTFKKMSRRERRWFLKHYGHDVHITKQGVVTCKTRSSDELKMRVKQIFKTYRKKIRRAASDKKKLKVIVRVFQQLEWLHAFRDGNGRTDMLVLQRLLCENGFGPRRANLHDLYRMSPKLAAKTLLKTPK